MPIVKYLVYCLLLITSILVGYFVSTILAVFLDSLLFTLLLRLALEKNRDTSQQTLTAVLFSLSIFIIFIAIAQIFTSIWKLIIPYLSIHLNPVIPFPNALLSCLLFVGIPVVIYFYLVDRQNRNKLVL